MTITDSALEARIEIAYLQFASTEDREERRRLWAEVERLCALRSPERVQRMEQQKGLRHD